jgi:hypothetical protein
MVQTEQYCWDQSVIPHLSTGQRIPPQDLEITVQLVSVAGQVTVSTYTSLALIP